MALALAMALAQVLALAMALALIRRIVLLVPPPLDVATPAPALLAELLVVVGPPLAWDNKKMLICVTFIPGEVSVCSVFVSWLVRLSVGVLLHLGRCWWQEPPLDCLLFTSLITATIGPLP